MADPINICNKSVTMVECLIKLHQCAINETSCAIHVPFCIDQELIAPGTISEGDFLQLSPSPVLFAQAIDFYAIVQAACSHGMSLSGKKNALVDYVSMAP
jgi:hypothetical protein